MNEVEPVGEHIHLHGQPVRRSGLSERARKMLQDTVPEETLTAYAREWPKFVDWCAARNVTAVPVSTDNLTNWVAERIHAKDSLTMIKQGIAAVVFFHDQDPRVLPKMMPDRRDAWRLVDKYRKDLVDSGWRPEQAATFTAEELRLMCRAIPSRGSGLRDRVVLLLGTAGYMRRSVMARLQIDDVLFVGDDARVYIARSKTDQRAVGKWTLIPHGEDPDSDPVAALWEWRSYLYAHGVRRGVLLRHFKKTGTGEWLTDKPIHPRYVGTVVRRWADEVGLEAPSGRRYRAHSVRASGATIAFEARRPAVQIAKDGGWSPTGTQVHQYDRPEGQDAAMRGLL